MPFPAAIAEAYRHCESITKAHYENFPVASLALPGRIRPFVYSVYAFARAADDFADEGSLASSVRLQKLDEWQRRLDDCYAGKADHPVFVALGETVRRTGIPRNYFDDLLTAFRMDVMKTRHAAFEDVLKYCSFSANPVGRIILILFDEANERNFQSSDKICTALQLANFWQDIRVDSGKGRIYVPLEDLSRFGYTETLLLAGSYNENFKNLMKFEIERTRQMFIEGKSLVDNVKGRLRFELNLTVRGGLEVLKAIERQQYNVLASRPVLSTMEKLAIFTAAIINGNP